MVVHAFNPNSWEAEVGRALWVGGNHGLYMSSTEARWNPVSKQIHTTIEHAYQKTKTKQKNT